MVMGLDPLLAYRTDGLDKGKRFSQYVHFPEINSRGIGYILCSEHLAAAALRVFLTYHGSPEHIACILMNQSFFVVCHKYSIIPPGDSRKSSVKKLNTDKALRELARVGEINGLLRKRGSESGFVLFAWAKYQGIKTIDETSGLTYSFVCIKVV
jgi:hypothetical protein